MAEGFGAGPRPARRHWGRVSSESLSSWVNAAWHMAWARLPHSCMIPPPVELGAVTVTQPFAERPYPPGLTAVQMPRAANPARIRAPTIAIPRLSRVVSGSAGGLWVFRYIYR